MPEYFWQVILPFGGCLVGLGVVFRLTLTQHYAPTHRTTQSPWVWQMVMMHNEFRYSTHDFPDDPVRRLEAYKQDVRAADGWMDWLSAWSVGWLT